MLTSCVQPASVRPQYSDDELQRERNVQERMLDEAAAEGGVPRPWRQRPGMKKEFERVAERIEAAGAQLCKDMGLPRYRYGCYFYFDLSTSRAINSFADGKTISITYGMMRFLQDDDELAGVMGHEFAHNMMKHRAAQDKNAQLGGILGAMLEGAAGMPRGDTTRAGQNAGILSYSKSFEAEADYIGLYVAARAGYNVSKVPYLWRRLTLEEPETAYIAITHPTNAERFVALQKTIEEINEKRARHEPLIPNFDPGQLQRVPHPSEVW